MVRAVGCPPGAPEGPNPSTSADFLSCVNRRVGRPRKGTGSGVAIVFDGGGGLDSSANCTGLP